MYTSTANLPYSLVNAGKVLKTALLGPPGVDLQELLKLLNTSYSTLENGQHFWSHHRQGDVLARGTLFLNVLDTHERYESLCCCAHNATHGCCFCMIESKDYGTHVLRSAPKRDIATQKRAFWQLDALANRYHTLTEMANLERALGTKYKKCRLFPRAISPFRITPPEAMHLVLLGELARRWQIMISMFSTRGTYELEVFMRDFAYMRGSKKLPPLKAHDSSMHAVDWIVVFRVGIFLLALVFSNEQNLNLETRRIIRANRRWLVELFMTFSNDCLRLKLLRMKSKTQHEIDEQDLLLQKIKLSDSRKFPETAIGTSNYHNCDHLIEFEQELGIAFVTQITPGERAHQEHKTAIPHTNQKDVAPQLMNRSNERSTLRYITTEAPWVMPDDTCVVAGEYVLEMNKWPIFDKFRAQNKFTGSDWFMKGIHLSFAHRAQGAVVNFKTAIISRALEIGYRHMGVPYNPSTLFHKFYRMQKKDWNNDIQGSHHRNGELYEGDDVFMRIRGVEKYPFFFDVVTCQTLTTLDMRRCLIS